MKLFFIKLFFLALSVSIVFMMVNVESLYSYISGLNIYFSVASLVFIVLNQILSSVRYSLSLKMFGVNACFQDLHKVNIYSIISGMLFFNFFGQGISRFYMVKDVDASNSSFIVTAFERVISLSVLLIISIVMSLVVLGSAELYLPSLPVAIMISFVFLSFAALYFFGLVPRQRREIRIVLSSGFGWKLWGITFVVILMHACMLCAYVCLILGMSGDVSINAESILASVLTMLGGALPISFGGWGAREVSASFAFTAASLPSELGVSVAIGVGLLTLVALGVNFLIVGATNGLNLPKLWSGGGSKSKNYAERLVLFLSWFSVPAILILMMVQFPVSLEGGRITFSLADPVAIVMGMTFALIIIQRKYMSHLWIDRRIGYWLCAAFSVLSLSYIIGFIEIGYSEWALYNRLVGSGVLFSYLVVGAAATGFWGEFAVRTAIKSLIPALVLVACFELLCRFGLDQNSLETLGWVSHRWTGFLNNPNSFSFFLMTSYCLIFVFSCESARKRKKMIESAALSLVVLLLYLANSKAGMISFFVISLFLLKLNWRKLAFSIFGAFLLYVSLVIGNEFMSYFSASGGGIRLMGQERVREILNTQPDRILSLLEGWNMFRENPILGGGLGAFYESQAATGIPLVIHNSFLWILAEMGLLGFSVIVVLPVIFCARILVKSDWLNNSYSCALLLILLNTAVMGMAHELVYQRVFWLVLGMLIATPFCLRKRLQSAGAVSPSSDLQRL